MASERARGNPHLSVLTFVLIFRCLCRKSLVIGVADGGGFEPPLPCGKHAFQACAIDHSATHPKSRFARVWKTHAPDFAEGHSAAKTRGGKRDVGGRVESAGCCAALSHLPRPMWDTPCAMSHRARFARRRHFAGMQGLRTPSAPGPARAFRSGPTNFSDSTPKQHG